MAPQSEQNKETLKSRIEKIGDFKLRGTAKVDAILEKRTELINDGKKVQRTEKGNQYQIKVHEVIKSEVKGNSCVEVYAQAWKNGKRVGFGRDGSVDIERFRIFNPPLLVPDANGDIVIERKIPIGLDEYETVTERFREDPEEAVRQSVIQTIAQIGKEGGNIQKGKVGRTTSTFYPSVDARLRAGSTNDRPPQSSDWDIAHDKTDCTGLGGSLDKTSTSDFLGIALLHSNYRVYVSRGGFFFDTSAIADDDNIDSAQFSLYVLSKRDAYNDGYDYINVVEATPASDSDIVTGDFDQMGAVNNPTQGATAIDIGAITTSAYNTWTLNATGEGWINKTGITTLAVREGHDIEDVYAGDGSGEDYTDITVSMSEETGTTQDPKLVVEHTPSSTQYDQAVTATAQANTSFVRGVGVIKSVTANATASFIRDIEKTISVTAQAGASFLRQLARELLVTAQGTPTLVAGLLYAKELLVTAQATASIVKAQVTLVALTVTAEATATIGRLQAFLKELSVTAQAGATITTLKTLSQVITATAQATASVVNTGLSLSRELVVTASATVTRTVQKALSQTITATGQAVVSLLKDFGYIDKYPENDATYEDKYPEN